MTVRQIPWTDIRQLPQLLRHSWRRHRASGADLADLTFVTSWRTGPAARAPGPYLFSFTQYTPARARDIPGILLAGTSLADQLLQIDTAVGVTSYIRPARNRQLGSLSVWTDPTGPDTFVPLPDHIETMNKYRPAPSASSSDPPPGGPTTSTSMPPSPTDCISWIRTTPNGSSSPGHDRIDARPAHRLGSIRLQKS
ncbi:hypothetical protein [Nocardia terpenica]|uniref:hypothetical protein n=1 Tax=Nocardia terpenica TaxID=455432 RepID=UPI0012FE6810|nr:hypothetical protein [Nocardia terpenica]